MRLVPLKTQPMFDFPMLYLQCGAPKISKLVYNSNNYGFMVLITIVTGAYKPTYNWGASHCRYGRNYPIFVTKQAWDFMGLIFLDFLGIDVELAR